MDSLTQATLGATVAAACVPPGHRRRALLAGALLGTLPDLDVLIDYGDAVANFTRHRGFSHSLLVLPPFAVLAWVALRRWWRPVREAPRAWLAAVLLALVTHPLLDAHTAYGTQLWWPLDLPPVSWSTLFIIDPLYTLPLLVGALVTAAWPRRGWSRGPLIAGLAVSSLYLGWSWAAKALVEQHARDALASRGLAAAPLFSVPTPFNTVLWRVVAMTGDGYLEAFDSLLLDEGGLRFEQYASDTASLSAAGSLHAVRRLRWFSAGFVAAEVVNGELVISDLRMGQETRYIFRFAVARRGNPHWQPILPRHIRTLIRREDVVRVWERMFEPWPEPE
jgi:inner membrane protein